MKVRIVALALFVAASGRASADTPFGTSVLYHNSSVIVNTVCWIYNGGSKPVRILSVGVPNYNPDLGSADATQDQCTGTLAPDRTCAFTTSLGVYGGGIAKVKGSTKKLRGECTLYNASTNTSIFSLPMR